ncbi:MAG: hypothetical protein JXR96_08870 [Deltaproteobacteria bacterium]|nr:hypothetical protein [Deltaproteobacteria bacterium]
MTRTRVSVLLSMLACLCLVACADGQVGGSDAGEDGTAQDDGAGPEDGGSDGGLDGGGDEGLDGGGDEGLDGGGDEGGDLGADSGPECQEGAQRCSGDMVQACAGGSWTDVEDCAAQDKRCAVLGGEAGCIDGGEDPFPHACDYQYTHARSFEERRQTWIDRYGTATDGRYQANLCRGYTFLFAWFEHGLDSDPTANGVGSAGEVLRSSIDVSVQAGCEAGLVAIRALLQYADVLGQDDIAYVKDKLRWRVELAPEAATAAISGRAVQLENTADMYLYVLHFDPELTFTFGREDTTYSCRGCSGTTYSMGQDYPVLQYTRDFLYRGFEHLLAGDDEHDSNYTDILIATLLVLYDYGEAEMKNRAKMMLDFMMLEYGMEYSGNQKAGAQGRTRHSGFMKNNYDRYMYPLLGLGPDKHAGEHGQAYVSGYRPSQLIQELVHVEREPDDYWHYHKERNGVASASGKWAYVTPHYAISSAGGEAYSDDERQPRWFVQLKTFGLSLKIWANSEVYDADYRNSPEGTIAAWRPRFGGNAMIQHRNVFFVNGAYDSLHVFRMDQNFDSGSDNLVSNDRGYRYDYNLGGSGWKFFRLGKTFMAIKQGPECWAFELAIEGVDYPDFASFTQAFDAQGAYCNRREFVTSKGWKIDRNYMIDFGDGTPQAIPLIREFPFPRMETIYGYGDEVRGNLVSWNNGRMTIEKNGLRCSYDFNDWTYSGSGCEGGQDLGSTGEAVYTGTCYEDYR